MKRISVFLAFLLSVILVVPAHARGFEHGGFHGGNYRHFHGGRGSHWIAPVLGAAILGGAIYAATSPTYVVAPQVVVQPQPQYMPPVQVAYFCSSAQQYYPNVITCQVPWQMVNY